ncbi:General transcription and DNA repair factor IIH subunit TFB2 [Erysiphe neolycopersici]|uniref:RNA polymerase II transcription factor B subunit 2 n=1 Tax=Erysiphe neolycopersici TaxID=212602 RepID=A0A420HFF1_9PEZI|nr:General transcription and DNA repair factor IIH subunit TFB2 [Erysiphe neolycopersici]
MTVSTLASFEYLERLPGTTFRKLYLQPSTALAVFRRMLPHLAKSFVMALLYMTKPLLLSDLDLWVQPKSQREREKCLSLLTRLHIVSITAPTKDSPQTISLTVNFGASLRMALTGGGEHQSFGVPLNSFDIDNIDEAFLDDLAKHQWEKILHYVVNSVGQHQKDASESPAETKQQEMLSYLSSFGLIYLPPKSSIFYPTRLATTLTSEASALRSVSDGFDAACRINGVKGFIIIETNYRVYAYTNSPLQIAVLALFTKFNSRYPNMVAGKITRESVAKAISHGITSDQIISYLSTHAHPQLVKSAALKGGPVLPPTVVDQIRLWQIESERMKATSGFLFRDFETQKEYESCAHYADEIGVLVWRNESKRMFFVTRHEQLRDFIKSRKNN